MILVGAKPSYAQISCQPCVLWGAYKERRERKHTDGNNANKGSYKEIQERQKWERRIWEVKESHRRQAWEQTGWRKEEKKAEQNISPIAMGNRDGTLQWVQAISTGKLRCFGQECKGRFWTWSEAKSNTERQRVSWLPTKTSEMPTEIKLLLSFPGEGVFLVFFFVCFLVLSIQVSFQCLAIELFY